MRFKLGDKVKFLNDVGEGIITKIVSETMVNVEIEDGFEVPYLASALLKVQSDQALLSGDSIDIEELEEKLEEEVDSIFNDYSDQYIIGNDKPNTFIAFLPQLTGGTFLNSVEVYLINDSNYKALYAVSKVEDGKNIHVDAGIIDANTKVEFISLDHKEIREKIEFQVQMIFYQARSYDIQPVINRKFEVNPLKIVDPGYFSDNDYFNDKAFLINLAEENLEELLTKIDVSDIEKEKFYKEKSVKKVVNINPESEIEEVDLHIEEIIDNLSGMSNSEILDIQISRFKIALEGAIRNKKGKIVFIHGVGNGTLRYEIRKHIDNNYPRCRYQDASFKEYGYGATMVVIK